jgi:hypothetical protein
VRVHDGAEFRAAGQRVHGPADVLAGGAHAGIFAVKGVVVVQVFGEPAPDIARGRGRRDLAGGRKWPISRKIQGRPCAARPDHQARRR